MSLEQDFRVKTTDKRVVPPAFHHSHVLAPLSIGFRTLPAELEPDYHRRFGKTVGCRDSLQCPNSTKRTLSS